MELDYRNLDKLVQIRQTQIEDKSLENDYFNTEYQALEAIKKQLAVILILERNPEEMLKEVDCTGEVKGEYHLDTKTYHADQADQADQDA